MRGERRWLVGLLALALAGSVAAQAAEPMSGKQEQKPRLILLVVVDQLRADYLQRFAGRFGPDGFARLMREGAWFVNCHYPNENTVTGPGHATLSTGTTPNRHGIADNYWYDWKRKRRVHAAYDDYHWVVSGATPLEKPADFPKPRACEVPTTKPDHPATASPCQLVGNTLGDELKLATGGRAKLFGISWKDRAAILASGKTADGAFWFGSREGGFVTSTYYRERLPAWLAELNRAEVDAYVGKKWAIGETVFVELTKPADKPQRYYDALYGTPFGNELVVKLAERLIVEEGLGADEVPDLLMVGFSANDTAGHRFGPYSEAVEELTADTDRLLARLFKFIEARVGAGNYWVALSADHGVAPTLAQARARGLPARNVPHQQLVGTAVAALEQRWGKDEWFIPQAGAVFNRERAGAVFNRETLVRHGASVAEAAQVVGDALLSVEGVLGWVSQEAYNLPNGYLEAFELSDYPGRVPDLRLLLEPFALVDGDRGETTHGTLYAYDTHVPLLFWGTPFRAGIYAERVSPADLAPTLAAALGLAPPAVASGRVLSQAVREFQPVR